MEYSSALKRNEVLMHATTWMNLENMLRGRNQSQKTAYHIIPFIYYLFIIPFIIPYHIIPFISQLETSSWEIYRNIK